MRRQRNTRRARLWQAAEERHVPLQAILAAVAVVVLVYLAGKVVDRLRGVILLLVVAGFMALLLNPLVVVLQRRLRRRGLAVTVVTLAGRAALSPAWLRPSGIRWSTGSAIWPSNLSDLRQQGAARPGLARARLATNTTCRPGSRRTRPSSLVTAVTWRQPALSVGEGAFSLLFSLLTIFVLVVSDAAGRTKDANRAARADGARSGPTRYSRVAREVNRSVTGYMLGNFATSS